MMDSSRRHEGRLVSAAGARHLIVGLAGLACALGAGAAAAQQPAQFTPNYRETDLRQVIDAVSAVTGRNFLVDPRVRGTITLYTSTPMSLDEFYEIFLAALSVNGFAAVPDGAAMRIVPDQNVRQLPSGPVAAEGEALVTRVVRVDNVNAQQLVPMLRPLQAQYGNISPLPDGNILVIVDRASNMERLIDIIEAIDQELTSDVDAIRLENAFAGEVAQTLTTMIQAQQSSPAARSVSVQVLADERTNSVLLTGTDAGRLRYRALVAYLDEPVAGGGDTRVRYLNYGNAEALAENLMAQFGGAVDAEGAEGLPPTELGPVNIWADAATNALVVTAPSRIMQNLMTVVDQLDIPRAQVLVEAFIAEVSEDKIAELGVTWIVDGSGDDNALGLTNFGSTTPGVVQLGAASQSETPSAGSIPEGFLAGIGRIRDSGTSWAALFSALRGDGANNVIVLPQVAVLDNAEAELHSGQEVPFLTGQFTSTGASEGAVNPFSTIQRQDVGTTLLITPQINEGNGMRLTISLERSGITGGASGAVDLITNENRITTEVYAADGEILVLGGLVDDQLRQSEQRVPVIGRIPGLGWLFRSRSTERAKTNLMLFIRPTIMRDSIQTSAQAREKYTYIREQQLRQAEEPVQLMRGETHPLLPELDPAPQPTATAEQEQTDNDGEPQ